VRKARSAQTNSQRALLLLFFLPPPPPILQLLRLAPYIGSSQAFFRLIIPLHLRFLSV
jgi:hypothetical protein